MQRSTDWTSNPARSLLPGCDKRIDGYANGSHVTMFGFYSLYNLWMFILRRREYSVPIQRKKTRLAAGSKVRSATSPAFHLLDRDYAA
jgi:hypothetical protein